MSTTTTNPLFTELDLGGRQMRNRIVQGPLSAGYANPDGTVSDVTVSHYARRARGGVGMVIIENYAVSWSGRQMHRQGMASGPEFVPGLRRLADAIKSHGALAVLQLVHAGRYAGPWEQYEARRRLAPSAVSFGLTPDRTVTPQEITAAEIAESVEEFATATGVAREAGFDGVEIHGSQGFLISSFQSPRMNLRDDSYGGDAEGRNRFPLEVVDAVVAAAGDMLVGYHLFTDELMEDGWTTDDALDFAGRLRGRGLDFVVPTPTTFESLRIHVMAGRGDPSRHVPEVTRALAEKLDCAVFANGGLGDPADAERVLAEDAASAIVLSRPLLTDPDWADKVRAGRADSVLRCSCSPPVCAFSQLNGVVCGAWPEEIQSAGHWGLTEPAREA